MILELADIRIRAGQNAAFEEAIERGLRQIIIFAKGFRSFQVQHSLESPERYVLLITWDTLEDHTVGFRQSEAFTSWRAIVQPLLCAPPMVEHFEWVAEFS